LNEYKLEFILKSYYQLILPCGQCSEQHAACGVSGKRDSAWRPDL